MAIDFNADQNRMGLALLAAAGPSALPMSFGQRMFMGMGQHDQYLAEKEQREQLRKAREAQLAFQQMQMAQMIQQQAERKAAQERATAIEGAYRGAIRTPQQQAMQQFGGPTRAAATAAPGMVPQVDQRALIESLAKVDPMTAFQMMAPKERKLTTVAPGASLIDESDPTKAVFTAPDKADKPPSAVQEYQFAKTQGYPGTFEQWRQAGKPAGTTVNVNTGDRIPHQLVKQQDDLIDKISTARAIDADLGAVEKQIASGSLQFGPVRNLINTGRNVAGISTEESRAFGTFKSTLEKLRNDSLRLNTGVQTEGDAQRAWNELFQNINDTKFVQQRLGEIRKINQRAAQIHEYRLNTLRQNSGAGPLQQPDIPPAIDARPAQSAKQVVRTGTLNGRKVVQYSDGSTEYAD
ncbi:MAG: hypothetical protein IPI51_07325 [Betaproteobacteria bacterium]|nr:hypothetical protein [Betaproteobacteria bacterium]